MKTKFDAMLYSLATEIAFVLNAIEKLHPDHNLTSDERLFLYEEGLPAQHHAAVEHYVRELIREDMELSADQERFDAEDAEDAARWE